MVSAHSSPVSHILLSSVLLLSPLCGCGGGSGSGDSGPIDSSEAGSPDAGSSDAGQIIVVDRDAQSGEHPGAEDAKAPSLDAAAPSDARAPLTDANAPMEDAGDGGWDAELQDSGSAIDSATSVDALAPEAGPPTCPSETLSCNGVCVPSDVNDCGACGRVCPGPTSGGGTGAAACVPAGCTVDCTPGFTACPAAPSLATTCIDGHNDDDNCGGCGLACQNGEHCVAGTCACTDGQHLCGSPATCVDETVSACGPSCQVCTAPAFATASCNGSSCQWACNAGYTGCPTANPTACDALGSDSNNCGACGHVCTGGETCQSGVCACPPGEALCSGTCVDEAYDSNNCAACGHSCLGAACNDAKCQPITLTTGGVGPIALDANDVYFTSASEVYSCPTSGCSSATALLSGNPSVGGIAYDPDFGARLIVSREQANVLGAYQTAGSLVYASSVTQPGVLTTYAGTVYVGSGTSIVLADESLTEFAEIRTVASGLPGPVGALAVDGSASVVYGSVQSAGAIVRAASGSSGAFETFVSNLANPASLVVASGNVYWTDLGASANAYQDGAALMCPTGTSCTQPMILGRGTACSSITSDASSVYFVCSDSMYQCPLAGCGAQGPWLLTTGVQSTGGMVNDAAAIYWVASSGAIMKVAK
jgi:hypothetical protein